MCLSRDVISLRYCKTLPDIRFHRVYIACATLIKQKQKTKEIIRVMKYLRIRTLRFFRREILRATSDIGIWSAREINLYHVIFLRCRLRCFPRLPEAGLFENVITRRAFSSQLTERTGPEATGPRNDNTFHEGCYGAVVSREKAPGRRVLSELEVKRGGGGG